MGNTDITLCYSENVIDGLIQHLENLITELKFGKVELIEFDFTVESNKKSFDGITMVSYATGVVTDKIRFRVLDDVPKPEKA